MNDINFIRTISRRNQHAIKYWINLCTCLIVCIVTPTLILQTVQWYKLYAAFQQCTLFGQATKEFDAIMAKKQELTIQKESLEKQINTLYRRQNSPTLPHKVIANLASLASIGTTQSLSIEKKQLTLTVLAPTTAQVHHYLKQLPEIVPTTQVRLTSLKPQSHNGVSLILFTLQATLK
jgi:Tfp pilus assembly protein PilN